MNLKIPAELHEQLKALANEEGRLIQWLAADALKHYIANRKRGPISSET